MESDGRVYKSRHAGSGGEREGQKLEAIEKKRGKCRRHVLGAGHLFVSLCLISNGGSC